MHLIPDYQLAYSLLQIRRNPAKWPQFKQGDSVLIRLGAVPVPVHHRPIWKLITIIPSSKDYKEKERNHLKSCFCRIIVRKEKVQSDV